MLEFYPYCITFSNNKNGILREAISEELTSQSVPGSHILKISQFYVTKENSNLNVDNNIEIHKSSSTVYYDLTKRAKKYSYNSISDISKEDNVKSVSCFANKSEFQNIKPKRRRHRKADNKHNEFKNKFNSYKETRVNKNNDLDTKIDRYPCQLFSYDAKYTDKESLSNNLVEQFTNAKSSTESFSKPILIGDRSIASHDIEQKGITIAIQANRKLHKFECRKNNNSINMMEMNHDLRNFSKNPMNEFAPKYEPLNEANIETKVRTPKIFRITKACTHHPPCIMAPLCQREIVFKKRCTYVPPCIHIPPCINLPLCVETINQTKIDDEENDIN